MKRDQTASGSHTVRINANASSGAQPSLMTRYSPRKAVTRLFAALGLDAERASTRTIDAREHADARSYGDLVKPLAGMLDNGGAGPDASR